VTNVESSDAKNSTARAISSGWLKRPIGMCALDATLHNDLEDIDRILPIPFRQNPKEYFGKLRV
jgi:hypothetical protein